MKKILLVEDDPNLGLLLQDYLQIKGKFEVVLCVDGDEGLRAFTKHRFDLCILDVMMPKKDGFTLGKEIRRIDEQIPIIFATAKAMMEDKASAYDLGGDDYITKPFSPKELVARIKAVMRRISPMAVEEVIEMQGLSLDPTSHRVMTGENPLDMGPTEFKLLHFFMTHPERVYSREQLLNNVWGTNVYVEDRTVDVHIRRLRKALELSGHDRMVQTVRGTGYRFSTRF